MRAGEKILLHRKKLGLTQKKLAELSGVSEISIRKYELGLRNPKPVQLKKLAKAMALGENTLLEIEVADITLDTIGDFMAILYQFIEKMDCYMVQDMDETGEVLRESTSIRFSNPIICEALFQVSQHFNSVGIAREEFMSTSPSLEEQVNYYLKEQNWIEEQKKEFLACSLSIYDPNAPVNKPMPDFENLLPPESEE